MAGGAGVVVVMCGGESDGERRREEVMIYSWRTWLGLSRAAVREERWRWLLDWIKNPRAPARCDSLASCGRMRAGRVISCHPLSHHFFSRAATTGSITATFPRIRPARRRPPTSPRSATPTPRDTCAPCPPDPPPCPVSPSPRLLVPPELAARSPPCTLSTSPPARHRPPSSRCTQPHDRTAISAGRTHTLSQRP